ncbi:MAG TPA: division/cell wall cluster transcriptional repressor MraZ [Candidatus Binataceae bacterium]|nr:division/cell wall cluster transcriptional repressor MraZ [Candidatus Binataceae bacterium]
MFSGRFDHAIDDKGRISLPVRFREVLDRDGHDRLYITNFVFEGRHCLAAYPPNEWTRLLDQIRQRARFDREVKAFELFYIGGAHEVIVDKQGRILIPPKLRDYAALKGEVTFSALTDHFQLWDKAALEEVLKAAEQRFSDPEFFQKLGF